MYSDTPGLVPRVSTAPVAMTLMKSAPPLSSARTRSRTWSAELATPKRKAGRQGDVRGGADQLAAAGRDGDVGAGHLHPRADHRAVVDRVPQGRVHEGAVGPHVAHRGEAREQRRPGVPDAAKTPPGPRSARAAAARRTPDLADEVGVAVDQAGQHGGAGEVDHPGAGRRPAGARQNGLDPLAPDHDELVPPDLAALHVHQPAGPDRDDLLCGDRRGSARRPPR